MPKTRSARFTFALVIAALLLIIGHNLYRHQQERKLETAVTSGDDATAAALLRQGVFTNDARHLEWLLSEAAMNNEPNTVRALLQQGTNPNGLPSLGIPLVAAIQHCPSVVGVLLDKGAKVNVQEPMGMTPLKASIDARQSITRHDARQSITRHVSRGRIVFTSTPNHSYLETMRLLLGRGADVNFFSREDTSPLLYATQQSDGQAIKLLLERGAQIDALSSQTRITALEAAVTSSQSALLIPLLLSAKPSLTTKNKALGAAVRTGNAKAVRVLLNSGAHPVAQSQEWLRDVNQARSHLQDGLAGYAQVFALLRSLGITATPAKAEIEARNSDGQTALLIALSDGNTQAAQSLLAQGANVNSADTRGNTPLMAAVEHNSPLIALLLDKGADPNIVTFMSRTPLSQAVQNSNMALVRLLLAHGASPNLHHLSQPSLLARARKHNQAELVMLLQKAGAKE